MQYSKNELYILRKYDNFFVVRGRIFYYYKREADGNIKSHILICWHSQVAASQCAKFNLIENSVIKFEETWEREREGEKKVPCNTLGWCLCYYH